MMDTSVLDSAEHFMPPNFQPERYREERRGGDIPHSLVQAGIVAYLWARRHRWEILVLPEIALAGGRLSVPDIGVIKGEPNLDRAPYLCIEIVAPDEDQTVLERRIEEYLDFGASFVWVIDPIARMASIHSADASVVVPDGWLRAEDIEVPLAEIFE
jgi:Uma2 family endonuclease